MTKVRAFAVIAMMFLVVNIDASIYIKYYNTDSKTHKFDVKTCGTSKSVEFGSSRTSSVTIQSGCDEAVIYAECEEVVVKTNSKVTIKNGCIFVD